MHCLSASSRAREALHPPGGQGVASFARRVLCALAVAALATTAACRSKGEETAGSPASGLRDVYVRWEGGTLHYLESQGSGPTIVFLHAGSGQAELFREQAEHFVAAGFHVVAYDRGGYGKSSKEVGYDEWGPCGELEVLVSTVDPGPVHLLGVAAGGGVALHFAIQHPERVASMLIANSIGNVQDESYREMLSRLLPKEFSDLPVEMRELGPSYRASNPQGVKKWLALSTSNAHSAPKTGASAPVSDDAGSVKQSTARPSLPAAKQRPVTFAALGELHSIPVMFLTGDADLYTPPYVLELFAAAMPWARHDVVRNSGHASYWENPTEFRKFALEFFRDRG